MTALSLLYNGTVANTAAIITALGVVAAVNIVVIPGADGQQVSIYKVA